MRVEGEPRWILTYAFNVGFRAAACDTILKLDADIVLSEDFFKRNSVSAGNFVAGNWRTAADDQSHVNGFFFIPRKNLHEVNGFNEHILYYGWDDEDIYDRLTLKGARRHDVAEGTIFHLPHSDEERTGAAEDTRQDAMQSVRKQLMSGTSFLIRMNRYVSFVMPPWNAARTLLPFRILNRSESVLTIRRDGWVPCSVPDHVLQSARSHALWELASWRFGKRAAELTGESFELLIDRPHSEACRIDVEVALASPKHVLRGPGNYVVVELPGKILDSDIPVAGFEAGLRRLIDAAVRQGFTLVIRAPHIAYPKQTPEPILDVPLIPSWEQIGTVPIARADVFLAGLAPRKKNLLIKLRKDEIAGLALAAPPGSVRRSKFYIDAQHGLGNRLRAIASAAAISENSGHELVIVWEPDAHCDCQFGDLFTYDGAVESRRFIETAAGDGAKIYNYMPLESGGQTDQPVYAETDGDIYARSAYVLKSALSSWESENLFLRSLTPVDRIQELVRSVRHPNEVSAHVRMEAGAGRDHNTWDRPENWRPEDHSLIHEWRAKSHFSHFLRRLDTLFAKKSHATLFLAADLPETYEIFADHFGEKLVRLQRTVYDRSLEQLHYAMADAILLGRSPLLLGSTWSSFSELAMRLAPEPIKIEMSGQDF